MQYITSFQNLTGNKMIEPLKYIWWEINLDRIKNSEMMLLDQKSVDSQYIIN